MTLRAPWPQFGGKSRIADQVWASLGDVGHYLEPFCGSAAVLLARPDDHQHTTETINDLDGFLTNAWRAIKLDPKLTASHCDWPVSELDLTARHRWICERTRKAEFLRQMSEDPDYFDAKIAGWWIWGISAWIGSGFCTGTWDPETGSDVAAQLPAIGDSGKGIHRPSVRVGNQLPHISSAGQGVNRLSESDVYAYFDKLSSRLRRVRICCGDWKRILTKGALTNSSSVGVFLDPPYSKQNTEVTMAKVYTHDLAETSEIAAWCQEHENDPKIKIVLAGRDGEYDLPNWQIKEWVAKRSYGQSGQRDDGDRFKERLWCSPGCDSEVLLF